MKVDKPVFEAYTREISIELESYNREMCKISQDKIKEDYYQTPEGVIIKSIQEINTSQPLINQSALYNRMNLKSIGNYAHSVIYNKLVIFSIKTDDYDVLKDMVFNHFKDKITNFYTL